MAWMLVRFGSSFICSITTAVEYLLKLQKDPKSRADTKWLTYGYFYAAPAMYMVGGEAWETWYGSVNKTLKDKAKKNELFV
jgi:hypothetical protein